MILYMQLEPINVVPSVSSLNTFLLPSRNGHQKFMYEGENNKNGLTGFMKNPSKPPEKPKEEDWSTVKSDVVHLTSENFDTVIMVCILHLFHNLLRHTGGCITTCFNIKESSFHVNNQLDTLF